MIFVSLGCIFVGRAGLQTAGHGPAGVWTGAIYALGAGLRQAHASQIVLPEAGRRFKEAAAELLVLNAELLVLARNQRPRPTRRPASPTP